MKYTNDRQSEYAHSRAGRIYGKAGKKQRNEIGEHMNREKATKVWLSNA